MTLVCFPTCLGVYEFESQPDIWKICKLNSPSLATNDEMVLDNLCPMAAAAQVVENLSEDNEKGGDFESPLEEPN